MLFCWFRCAAVSGTMMLRDDLLADLDVAGDELAELPSVMPIVTRISVSFFLASSHVQTWPP